MSRYSLSSLTNTLDAFVTPPFTGTPILLWLCFVLFSIASMDPLWRWNLSDPDDYLYLVQALDWLNGQSWFDLIQHRMDPPQGTFIHYSHLLSGFYAGFIFLLQPFFGATSAALITAAILPPVYLALLFFSVRWLAQVMIAPKWGDLTAYILFFSTAIMSQFVCGAIHHHGIEALLAIVAFCCIARMVEHPSALVWAVAAGFTLALGLTIGLEIIAILGLFSLCLGVWATIEGSSAARSGLVFASTLFICSLCFLLMTRPQQHIFDAIIPAYSIVYVVLTGSIAFCFLCVVLADKKASELLRYIIGVGVACATGWVFLHCFPELKAGPYGGVDASLAKLIFTSEPEAWPIVRKGATLTHQIFPLIWPVLAIGSNLFIFIHAPNRAKRWLWGMILLVLSTCLGLAAFYQCRFLDYTQPFAVLPLTAMVRRDWEQKLFATHTDRALSMMRLALILIVGPVTMIAAGNFDDDSLDKANQSTTLMQPPSKGCDMHFLAELLNDKQGYGGQPGLIINSLNEGSELLFRTKYSVLAAPYHMNVQGNLDALRFFTTPDPTEAENIAKKRKASLVILCNEPSQLRAYRAAQTDLSPSKTTFVQQLVNNKIPLWLKPIQSPRLGDLMLFEIHSSTP